MKSFKYILLLISLFSCLVPANAIWLSVDPLSDKYPHISPYAYCNWNPIKYVDPTGKDVYRYDYHTGEFSLYQTTDDEYDLIGKFRYNKSIGEYEPRMQKDGSVKTYADHLGNSDKIAKGILRDGLNIRENGGTIISDQIGTTLDDIYNFALILDEVAGVEISGFVLEAPVEKNQTLGKVYFEIDGEKVGECSILNEKKVERRSVWFVFSLLWSSFTKKS